RFDNPAGLVENQRIEGTFCGTYYSSKTILSSKEINNGDISVSSYIYDSGELVVDILKVKEDQTGVEKTDTIYLSQVDFVTLLQNGYYWKRPLDSDDDSTIEKITLIA
ncbi:hypothetical protein EA004_25570, partial [Vibrio anguillarum]|nr:hypothetical protein [Vibrio anguillarum]